MKKKWQIYYLNFPINQLLYMVLRYLHKLKTSKIFIQFSSNC